MNKILIGAILASSLAMAGDLDKCSHALEREDQFEKLAEAEHKKLLDLWSDKGVVIKKLAKKVYKKKVAYAEKQEALYRAVRYEWAVRSKKECKSFKK